MNDGVTRALLNTGAFSPGGSNGPQIKLLEIPAALQKQSVISGEVVASKDGNITLKTPQGNVVFQTDIAVAVGQKVTLKLQVVVQNAQQNLLVELTAVNNQPAKGASANPTASDPAVSNPQAGAPLPPKPDPVSVSTQSSQIPVPKVDVKTPQTVQEVLPSLPNDPKAVLPLLQAKIVELPKAVSQEALNVLMKEILNLPMQKPLPPTLQEGMVKLNQIMPLIAQAVPAQAALPPVATDVSDQNVLMSLTQLLRSAPTRTEAGQVTQQPQSLTSWPVQTLSLLQVINPGESLTPDLLTQLITKVMQLQAPSEGQVPMMPSAALILGQKPVPSLPAGVVPTLVLAVQPNTQQALVFITGIQKTAEAVPLLPGTVLIAAVPQQQAQTVPLNVSFASLLQNAPVPELLPLHPAVGDTWPALQHAWSDALAQQAMAPALAALMQQTIPSPTPQQMPPAMLFFMAALRMASPEAWLGGALGSALGDKLQQAEKTALIGQLSRDMQAIRAAMSDSTPDVWRPLPMPLQVNNDIMRVQWFYRHQYEDLPRNATPEETQENKKRRKTRFVLDVPKTRLGDIQIDGLMQDRNLDLILRTENMLGSEQEKAIRGRYNQALETAGIFGAINFQFGRQDYVQV